jgi:hypothetical protein
MTAAMPLDWNLVRRGVTDAFRSSLHCSVATLNEDGSPHLTPIGSVLLTEVGRGIYFEIFTTQLARNLERDPRLEVMAVHGGKGFWLSALARGRFSRPPGFRLSGRAGPRRPATAEEQCRWRRTVRRLRRLRGHDLLWGQLTHVRDLTFDAVTPVRVGALTGHLPSSTASFVSPAS